MPKKPKKPFIPKPDAAKRDDAIDALCSAPRGD